MQNIFLVISHQSSVISWLSMRPDIYFDYTSQSTDYWLLTTKATGGRA